jgi:hypothetical protein
VTDSALPVGHRHRLNRRDQFATTVAFAIWLISRVIRRAWPGSEYFELLGERAMDGDRTNKIGGRPQVDDRAALAGMRFVLRLESPGACCRPRWDAARA